MAITQYGHQVEDATINIASAGVAALIPASSGESFRVVSLWLRADDVVTVQFLSDATGIGGSMRLVDGDVVRLEKNDFGHFGTTEGEALNLSTSNGTQVSGWLTYKRV